MSNPETKQPTQRRQFGRVKMSIWENESEHGPFHSVRISRSYKDAQGEFQDTSGFSLQDLPFIELAAREALEFLTRES